MLPTIFWVNNFPDYILISFRTISTFSNPLNLCAFLVFPLGVMQFQKNKTWKNKLLVLLIYLTLILTASKLAVLIIIICLLVYLRKHVKAIVYSSFFLSIALFIVSFSETFQDKLKSSFRIYERLNNSRLFDGSINQRKYILDSSIEMIKDNPIFGIGYGNFREVYLNGYKHENASASLSSFTSEFFLVDFYLDNGLFPFIIILSMFLYVFYVGFKSKNLFIKQFSFALFLFFICGFILSTRAITLLFTMFIFFAGIFKLTSIYKHEPQ